MQRLLTTLETGSDLAAGTRGLTLVTTATGLAQATTDTTTGTQLFATGTRRRTQIVHLHGLALHTEHVLRLVDPASLVRSSSSEERRVGKECVSTFRSGLWPSLDKTKRQRTN